MNKSISLSEFEFEAWIDSGVGKVPEGRVTISLRRPDNVPGLRYVSFFIHESELSKFSNPAWTETLEDVTHRMNISGDRVMFYDLELPMHWEGQMTIPYLAVHWPTAARKVLARMAKTIWRRLKANWNPEGDNYNLPRVRFSFTAQQAERLETRYGHGTGKVDFQISENVRERYAEDLKNGNFAERVEWLAQITRNTTSAHWQIGTLYISRDADGYYFSTVTPWKKRSMHGGVINHGRDGKPDWSIHT